MSTTISFTDYNMPLPISGMKCHKSFDLLPIQQ